MSWQAFPYRVDRPVPKRAGWWWQPLDRAALCFTTANALDVFMTYLLLTQSKVPFFESNPVARYFLEGWGFLGMALFKATVVLMVLLNSQFIARTRQLTARRLLEFSTIIVSAVVLYSVYLTVHHQVLM